MFFLLLFIFNATSVNATVTKSLCNEYLQHGFTYSTLYSEDRFHKISTGEVIKGVRHELPGNDQILLLADNLDKELAYANYTFEDKRLWIHTIWVNSDVKHQGVQTILMELLLLRYPTISSIEATLILDNEDAFLQNYRLYKDSDRAIRSTPFYKSASKHGFKNIDRKITIVKVAEDMLSATIHLKLNGHYMLSLTN